ncbi:jg19740 [Pararge aegeria aegeria]|uniref:Jg19740 protein n=1 Tax=Pararge aegeria aegeria TaxID=348720 RepID=A0A8S4RTF4_9NEOP|nr:jg19740 [Pararge aegeria aegeria]
MEHARPPSELCLEGGPACRATACRKWRQQFFVFLKPAGVHKETTDVQASLLVNLIGSEGYDTYTTFKYTKDESRENIVTLVNKFNEHFWTKQNTTMVRFKFFTRNQEADQSVVEYVTALKILSEHCEFEHLEEGTIRDRIVYGVLDGKVRDRLLRTEELTLLSACCCKLHC